MFMDQISNFIESKNTIKFLQQKIKETNYYWIGNWIKNNLPEYITSFEDSLSQGQYDSKRWLCDELKKVYVTKSSHIEIIGSWFGFPIIEMLTKILNIKQIDLYEIDKKCHNITAQYINHFNYDFKIAQFENIFDRKDLRRRQIIINTSCEHMNDIVCLKSYYKDYPTTPLLVLQSNNYFELDEHINCVNNENELIEKNQIREVYFKGTQSLPMYDRYMVIGRW